MKRIFEIFILIFVINSCHKVNTNNTAKNDDTIFIFKDEKLGAKQSIYFDKNQNSKVYNELKKFEFHQFDKESYESSLKNIQQNLKHEKPKINETEWIPLYSYKNKYYVYYPCDFYNYYKLSINDSTLIDWTGEGPIANQILSQKKIKKNQYDFELKGYQKRKLIIQVIDSEKGIAIFENQYENEKPEFHLMVSANKINQFPLIINNCEMNKQNELDFDKIDEQKLINDYR